MENKIKVSIIIPVYGVEKYIRCCAESLFAQTLDDIEFLFINDCTPDKSMAILSNVIYEYDDRIKEKRWLVRIESMPVNSGQAAVRKHGALLAKGEYIIHCDSDDWVAPDMYRVMYEKATEDNADVVVCDIYKDYGGGKYKVIKGCNSEEVKKFTLDILWCRISGSLCNKLYKRTAYNDGILFPSNNMAEDFATSAQLIRHCNKVSYIPKSFYHYVYNPQSITKNKSSDEKILKIYFDKQTNMELVLNAYKDCNDKDIKKALLFNCLEVKFTLYPIARKYKKLYNTNRPGFFRHFLFSPNVSVRIKVRHLLFLLRLYPFTKNS